MSKTPRLRVVKHICGRLQISEYTNIKGVMVLLHQILGGVIWWGITSENTPLCHVYRIRIVTPSPFFGQLTNFRSLRHETPFYEKCTSGFLYPPLVLLYFIIILNNNQSSYHQIIIMIINLRSK